MRDLILKNSEWFRGKGSSDSALLREDGRRCCLGIAARASGIPDTRLLGVRNVPSILMLGTAETRKAIRAFQDSWIPIDLTKASSKFSDISAVARINDRGLTAISDEDRIAQLQVLFEPRGINLIFDPEN